MVNVSDQLSGIVIKGNVIVQVKSPDTLRAVISKPHYAPMSAVAEGILEDEIKKLEFHNLQLSGRPFEIKLKQGVIQEVLVDQDVPAWEVNLLKSVASQLQIDTQGENVIASRNTQIPGDNLLTGTFKAMEDSVGGKCEVVYNIKPLPEDVLHKEPEIIPLPNLSKDDYKRYHYINVTKTKDYVNCEQRMAYYSGIVGNMNWKSSVSDQFYTRSSKSQIIISGNLKRFTIQSSVLKERIRITSKIENSFNGHFHSHVNLTLDSVGKISSLIPEFDNLVSVGNLMYTHNNPFSTQSKQSDGQRSSSAFRKRNSNSSSEESRINDDSSSLDSNDDRDYLQSKLTIHDPPESSLLPYFVGYKGKSIQKVEENLTVVAARSIGWITSKLENFPTEILEEPYHEILDQYTVLVELIRTMNVTQMTEIEDKLPELFKFDPYNKFSNKEDQKLFGQTAWDVFCNAVAQAGTGPALITVKNWIKNKKLEGLQAANIISRIPKAARAPTSEYIRAFFELITDEQVRNDKFLNTTAPLSFAELVRYSQSKSIMYYPVPEQDNALLETYIPYMATQLRQAIRDNDSPRIQTYIMALSNFGHFKVLSVFEPYLEGTLQVSKFQRLMMVISLNKLSENFPRTVRSVTYKIYENTLEAYEIRCAAVYVLMKTNPPPGMLEKLAESTNKNQNIHVSSAIKTTINSLANLKLPELQDLANKARIAARLLNPDVHSKNYTRSAFTELKIQYLNIAQLAMLHTIGSEDSHIDKNEYIDVYQSYGNINLPSSRLAYSVSSINDLLDIFGQIFNRGTDEAVIIEDVINKLGFKPEDSEQFEGNIYMDTMFNSFFYPVDNRTFEELFKMVQTYAPLFKEDQAFKTKNFNNLYLYDMTLAFPSESGFPFIYTVMMPKLTRISGGRSITHINTLNEKSMEITVAGNILLSEKIQSRIGFVVPFEHRHYIAGTDINVQMFIPSGLSCKKREGKNKFEFKIIPDESYRFGTGLLAIHHSVVPYTSRHDILSFKSFFNNDTLIIYLEEPHKLNVALPGGYLSVSSEYISAEDSQKTGMEALSLIYKALFANKNAYYKRIDVFFRLPPAEVNVTYATFAMSGNGSQVTIPATIDHSPESEERAEQFLNEVSKDVYSSVSSVYDISIFSDQIYQVITIASAYSHVEDKSQLLFYWNMQSPEGRVFSEMCTVGYEKSSRVIPLNFEKALVDTPFSELNAEIRFGNCTTGGETIILKGNLTRTDDVKSKAMASRIVEKCWEEKKQGDIWLPNCQKASDLIRKKNYLKMSIDTNSDDFYMYANNLISTYKAEYKPAIGLNRGRPYWFGNKNKKTIDLEVKVLPDNKDVDIVLRTSSNNDISLSFSDIFEEVPNNLVETLFEEDVLMNPVCILDKTKVVTYDGKVYSLKLGDCWHVMLTTYPKHNPNNPEQTLGIPRYKGVIVMAREMIDGSKQIRMVLGDQEIHLQKLNDRLEAKINDEIGNFSRNERYVDETFEIYWLDGMIAIFSAEYEIYAVYDGIRILFESSNKYMNSIRGLCGNYDMQPDNDFITPKNCILTKPEEFVATYALTQDNCHGPSLLNKRKAEESVCVPRTYHPSDVISDINAGRSPSRRRGHH
ncbi:hypothetical protein PUN28_012279 [Cardiocondyla obscurior]